MMKEQEKFFAIMMDFRRLNISSILPGISHGDHILLQHISCLEKRAEGRVKVSQVVKAMELPPPAISRGLRILDNKGYIVRAVDEQDRRNTFVALTESGRAILKEADSIVEGFGEAVFANMGDEVMRKLNGYFRQLVDISREEIEKRKYEKKGDGL